MLEIIQKKYYDLVVIMKAATLETVTRLPISKEETTKRKGEEHRKDTQYIISSRQFVMLFCYL